MLYSASKQPASKAMNIKSKPSSHTGSRQRASLYPPHFGRPPASTCSRAGWGHSGWLARLNLPFSISLLHAQPFSHLACPCWFLVRCAATTRASPLASDAHMVVCWRGLPLCSPATLCYRR